MSYQFDDFNGCLNQPFTLQLDESTHLRLILISVDKNPGSATVGEYDAFSVVFRGDNTQMLEQQTYNISNDTLGDMALFIVPIGPDDKGLRYEAVFS